MKNIIETLITRYNLSPIDIAQRCQISVAQVYNIRKGQKPHRNTQEKLDALVAEQKGRRHEKAW